MERELARARASLALEEQKNARAAAAAAGRERGGARRAGSPPASPSTWRSSREHDMLTIRPYMDPALRSARGPVHASPARASSSPRWTTATRR